MEEKNGPSSEGQISASEVGEERKAVIIGFKGN